MERPITTGQDKDIKAEGWQQEQGAWVIFCLEIGVDLFYTICLSIEKKKVCVPGFVVVTRIRMDFGVSGRWKWCRCLKRTAYRFYPII
jgi:hypothetical protein